MEPRINKTKTSMEFDNTLDLDTCCEPDCGITITVDKVDKEMGRKSRCTACLMRAKTIIPLPKK